MMTKTEYRQYIQSEQWQDRRRAFLTDNGVFGCSECGMPRWLCPVFYDQDIHVDHKNYQHVGCEKDTDLQALCPRCHDIKHHGSSKLEAPNPPECPACGDVMWGFECGNCLRDYFHYLLSEAAKKFRAADHKELITTG